MDNKCVMRKKYREIRKSLDNRQEKNNRIFEKCLTDSDILTAKTLLVYASSEEEVDTKNLIIFFVKSKQIALPRIEDGKMVFHIIESIADLSPGYFGIYEPTVSNPLTDFSDSVCIVPGICFDGNGFRIGYGKGFYDRFLSKYTAVSIGLCYSDCLTEKIDTDDTDISVSKILTDF